MQVYFCVLFFLHPLSRTAFPQPLKGLFVLFHEGRARNSISVCGRHPPSLSERIREWPLSSFAIIALNLVTSSPLSP